MLTAAYTDPFIIKRYARSRLYDTANQRYVSVEQLRSWHEAGVAFYLNDTDTRTDVTRVLLA